MYRDVLKIFLLYRLPRSVVNLAVLMSLSTCGVHEFCREKFKLVKSFSCPSSVLVNMIYCSVKFCFSNSYIPGVILHSIMKSIKTPNHPAYHWSTLRPLEVWVRGLDNSWWFCVHKLSMFIYLSMRMTPETWKLLGFKNYLLLFICQSNFTYLILKAQSEKSPKCGLPFSLVNIPGDTGCPTKHDNSKTTWKSSLIF